MRVSYTHPPTLDIISTSINCLHITGAYCHEIMMRYNAKQASVSSDSPGVACQLYAGALQKLAKMLSFVLVLAVIDGDATFLCI
jgi:hypothetical protein